MKLTQVKKFLNAAKSANIKKYHLLDDIGSRFINDDNAVVLLNESDETLWNFRKPLSTESREGIVVNSNNIDDIRRAEIIADYDQIKKFIDAYGLSLDNDQLKILLNLNIINKEVMPITGDYHNIFHKLSDAEYEALSPEDKEIYDAHVKEEEKRYDLPRGTAARITY